MLQTYVPLWPRVRITHKNHLDPNKYMFMAKKEDKKTLITAFFGEDMLNNIEATIFKKAYATDIPHLNLKIKSKLFILFCTFVCPILHTFSIWFK